MSGLLALLDDVAAISKVAAASVDDIATNAAKAGAKTIGVIIDDTAVTPNYVVGITAARELPMVARIALGSLRNKAFLIPGLLVLDYFLPVAIIALLMIGGAYLCYEGAEKIWHKLSPSATHDEAASESHDPTALEKSRVAGAVKTDFILSAEIMTIALSMIETNSLWVELASLCLVGILVTALVYGFVAVIVKLDDFGVFMARSGRLEISRQLGHWIVSFVPKLLWLLTVVGTAAMLWVGGNIFIHGMYDLGLYLPYEMIEGWASYFAQLIHKNFSAVVHWVVTAFFDGIFGLLLGLIIIPIISKLVSPAWATVKGRP